MNARTLLIPRTLLILCPLRSAMRICAVFQGKTQERRKEDRTESQTGSSAQKTSGKVR